MKKKGGGGVSPACEQSFVSLTPLFVPLLKITSLCYLEKKPILEVHKWANPSKMVGLPTLTPK